MAVESGSYSPETIARRQKIADLLLLQSLKPREIRNPIQGLGQLGEAALAGWEGYRADNEEKTARKEAIAQAMQAFGGDNAPAAPMPSPAAPMAANSSQPPTTLVGNNPQIPSPQLAALAPDAGVAPPPRATVPSSAKVIGDDEGVKLGLYDPPKTPGMAPPAPVANVASALAPSSFADRFSASNGARPPAAPPASPVATALNAPPPAPTQIAQNAPAAPAGAQGGRAAAIAAMLNPWTPPALATALGSQINPSYGFQTLPDGTIVRTDPKKGTVEPIYSAPTKSTFGKIGQNRDGQDIYGFINPEKGTAKPVDVPAANANTPDGGLTGEDFLKSMNDPGRADLIKGMVEGRMAPAQMGRYGTQAVQSLLKDAARYEPGFDMTKWGARANTAKDFASGQAAKNVTALNTVIGHMGDLAEKADALQNFSGLPLVNKTANEIKNWMAVNSGKPEVKNFNLARNAVADEMAKVFRGSGLSDAETRQWKENISAAGSPEELRGAISTAIGLMESRLNAMGEQRNKGMSTQTEPTALLTDKSRETLEKVKRWAAGEKPNAAADGPDPAAIAEAKRRGLIK